MLVQGDTRLLLFDLDGTLLRATRGADAFGSAVREVFGIEIDGRGMRFDGKTDPRILSELLERAGSDPALVPARLRTFEACLGARFEAALARGDVRVDPVPGVGAVLRALAADSRYVLGILTGNLERIAWLKLEAAALADFFTLGAYGSDHAERAMLVDVARTRFRERDGLDVARERCIVIGDTPLDFSAAAANGAPAVLVASGRTPIAELATLGAAAVFADWADPTAMLQAFATL